MSKTLKSLLRLISSLFIIRKINSETVYLTFDDGPHPTNTEKLLGILLKYNAKSTFFMVGKQMELHPNIVEKVCSHGHSIGYHSYQHTHAKDSGFLQTYRELKYAEKLEKKLRVNFNRLYRPPYGAITLPVFLAILVSGWKIILWSKDSKDSFIDWKSSADEITAENVHAGDIILLHDDYKNTSNTIDLVLDNYKNKNLLVSSL